MKSNYRKMPRDILADAERVIQSFIDEGCTANDKILIAAENVLEDIYWVFHHEVQEE